MALELAPCRVHGEGGELIAAGHVRSADGSSLHVTAPRYTGHALAPGDRVVLEVASAVRGECTFDAVVARSTAGAIELAELHLRDVVQRRSAVRAPVDIPITFTTMVEDGEDVPLDPPIQAVVIDVSADGLRFRIADELPLGTQLRAELAARRPVPVVAEVLRHESLRVGVAHGCRFLDMTERDRDAIVAFVLQEERRMIAERRDTLSG